MLREETPDAQRKESLRLLMEGEQGEDQNTGSGGDQVGPGGRVCALRGHIHGKLGDSGIRGALSGDLVPQSTACAPEPLSASRWKAALLKPCFPQADSARLQISFLVTAPKYHSLLDQGRPRFWDMGCLG